MENQITAPRPAISDSTFQMLRCVITVAHADHVVKEAERSFLRTLVAHVERSFILTRAQLKQLEEDLRVPQNIERLLGFVTERGDREQLVLFAGLLAQADGEMHPNEEAILRKIQAHHDAAENDAASGGAGTALTAAVLTSLATQQGAGGGEITVQGNRMPAFADEVRDIVRQEIYRQHLTTSGITRGMRPATVVDAFAEKSIVVSADGARPLLKEMPDLSHAMKRSLVPGERLAGEARFHWVYVFDAVLLTLLMWWLAPHAGHAGQRLAQYLLASPRFYLAIGQERQAAAVYYLSGKYPLVVPALLCYGLAIWYLTWKILVWKTTEILVTDRRILIKQGILSISRHKLELNDMGETTVRQSIFGKLLDYGSIDAFTRYLSSTKGAGISLPPIADPHGFSTLIDRAQRMWFMGQGGNFANVRPVRG